MMHIEDYGQRPNLSSTVKIFRATSAPAIHMNAVSAMASLLSIGFSVIAFYVTAMSIMSTLAVLALMPTHKANAQTYYLGVLAPQGEAAAQQRWQPWLDSVNANLADDTLVLVPLALENWQQQIEAQQFAMVLGPQVQLIKMDTLGWRWLATLQNYSATAKPTIFRMADVKQSDFQTDEQYKLYKQLQAELALSEGVEGQPLANETSATEQIASALWVARDSNIEQIKDLQQRKIAAVTADAFGGYLLIAHLLQDNGLSANDYQVQFVGYPIELTLYRLASGAVDAAIAPLCLMEQMNRQGKINLAQYRLLNPVATSSNCQSSTKIYPNWTLAATAQAPASLVEQINQQLFAVQLSSKANDNTNAGGNTQRNTESSALRWLPPESSIEAERILYELGRHPSQQTLGAQVLDWIQSHRWWMSVIVFIVLISMINYAWMSWLAWRRRQQLIKQNRLISDYDQQLRRSERFAVIGEMSGAIAHEINQPLATIQNYAQGLLIRSQNSNSYQEISAEQILAERVAERQMSEKALQQIVSETERVAAVITNIRRWAGRSTTDETKVNIAETYQQCIILMGDKAIDISFGYASNYQYLQLPSLVLDQLLINVMLNAQQQGAKHVMLRCQKVVYKELSWLALILSDDGGGFDQDRLTAKQPTTISSQQPHYAAPSSKAEGLGLGLMICQRLCKSLGGMMQLSNIDSQQELADMQKLAIHYQLHLKHPSLNRQIQLSKAIDGSSLNNQVGAQVKIYLPLNLVRDNQNITD
ncbi:PhnD/SsuA/transferrin family substrate-binding protein [Psychrobacter sp. BF1]|uniref:sensor histidine kinase n=1 Tax=Psychrobacter sp. BF1 TaxID=2821147 RepID=UPI001C4E2353|nr:PhnD/SsuA/transferrin family substrate-binding protein [Psychrobacter sp. BF1]